MASTSGHTVVDTTFYFFYATWQPHSQSLVAVIEEMKADFPSIHFVCIDVDQDERSVAKYQVQNIPALIVCSPGSKAKKIESTITAPALVKLAKSCATPQVAAVPAEELTVSLKQANLESRMHALIHSAPVMVFMKGEPSAAQCKFSKKLMGLFQTINFSEFNSFNILEDEDIRAGLKTYSNWKTYPQIYIKGELIGGVDIVAELIEDEEFGTVVQEALSTGANNNEQSSGETLNAKLERVINKDRIMLFMKGTPEQPRCGFSAQMIQLLQNTTSHHFSTFDILEDNEVRQGLKDFSNWRTFPQLYVKGELIGGLDVCQEMAEEDELKEVLEAVVD